MLVIFQLLMNQTDYTIFFQIMKYVSQAMPYAVKIEIESVVGWSCIFLFSYNTLYSQGNDLTTDDLEMACIEVKLPYNKPFFCNLPQPTKLPNKLIYLINGHCF